MLEENKFSNYNFFYSILKSYFKKSEDELHQLTRIELSFKKFFEHNKSQLLLCVLHAPSNRDTISISIPKNLDPILC